MQKGVNIVFEFLSTPSARRATCSGRRPRPAWTDFYPRPPRGGRHGVCAARHDSLLFLSTPSARRATQHSRFCYVVIQFLSTPSARRATGLGDKWFQDHQISIHALREEGDHSPASSAPMALYFYPRPPRGGRPGCTTADGNAEVISIHALREEGDVRKGRKMQWYGSFLSTPSARRAT